ncbi:hypothetical protein GCM10010519_53770 [Streptomyces lactacystinicus]
MTTPITRNAAAPFATAGTRVDTLGQLSPSQKQDARFVNTKPNVLFVLLAPLRPVTAGTASATLRAPDRPAAGPAPGSPAGPSPGPGPGKPKAAPDPHGPVAAGSALPRPDPRRQELR